MEISVLIITCNRAQSLELCLLGYLRQSEGQFEIVISDDGSTDSTPQLVEEFKAQAPFPVTYLWQPLKGHRRAEAINRAIAAASHEWLLFSDCDSIPRQDLVATHRREADSRRLLCGGRVLMDEQYSASLTPQDIADGSFEEQLTPRLRRQLLWLHLRNRLYIAVGKKRRPHNYGLNMSCSREAMRLINGYDHNFQGWGNADGDVRDRLKMVGVWPKSIVHKAIIYHIWHPPHPTVKLRLNKAYARRARIPARCEVGLDSVQLHRSTSHPSTDTNDMPERKDTGPSMTNDD